MGDSQADAAFDEGDPSESDFLERLGQRPRVAFVRSRDGEGRRQRVDVESERVLREVFAPARGRGRVLGGQGRADRRGSEREGAHRVEDEPPPC